MPESRLGDSGMPRSDLNDGGACLEARLAMVGGKEWARCQAFSCIFNQFIESGIITTSENTN